MTATARRPVPHIVHTPELEAAAVAVENARDSRGNRVQLCQNPLDVERVRFALGQMAEGLRDPTFFLEDEPPNAELAGVENLILLANLLREHLRGGNT